MFGTTLRVLNGKRMDSREHAHAHLARRLRLPSYYGNNLDALNDCLGEIVEPTRILLRNASHLRESLGEYGERLIAVLAEAAERNPSVTFVLREFY
ncbi:MAG: barstar family protein [Christensenella sp.]|nr:barstar family protein [Christensenella sp.]